MTEEAKKTNGKEADKRDDEIEDRKSCKKIIISGGYDGRQLSVAKHRRWSSTGDNSNRRPVSYVYQKVAWWHIEVLKINFRVTSSYAKINKELIYEVRWQPKSNDGNERYRIKRNGG